MPRKKNSVPTYQHHKPSDRAYVRFTTGDGPRRTVYLGKFNSPESQAEYRRILAELEADSAPKQTGRTGYAPVPNAPTVNEILLAFLKWADGYYRAPDGKPTSEVNELKLSLRPVRELYGHVPASEFGPKSRAAVRHRMVTECDLCRTLANQRINRIRQAFKWAVSEELIPATVVEALRTLAGLKRGRTSARESAPIGPVEDATVNATLPFLDAHVRGMVERERLTGMRPGEVCGVTLARPDRGGEVRVPAGEAQDRAPRQGTDHPSARTHGRFCPRTWPGVRSHPTNRCSRRGGRSGWRRGPSRTCRVTRWVCGWGRRSNCDLPQVWWSPS